jgi:hypothetical protein
MTIGFNHLHVNYNYGNITVGRLQKDLPTPTPTPLPTSTPTPTPSRSPTPTPSPSRSPTPTPTPSRSPTPTPSPSASPAPTPTPIPTGFASGGLLVKLNMSNFVSGSTTWTNLIGNGNNGVLTNGPIPVSGSIKLDGTNDYITFTSGGDMKPSTTEGITLQVWAKITPKASTSVFGKLSSSYGYDGYIMSLNSSGVLSSTTNGTSVDRRLTGFSSGNLIASGQWNLLTFTTIINGTSGSTRAYVNDKLMMVGTHGADSYNESNFLRVGQGYHTSSPGDALNGNIAEFYFYNRQLSLSEITNNYNDTKSKFGL